MKGLKKEELDSLTFLELPKYVKQDANYDGTRGIFGRLVTEFCIFSSLISFGAVVI